MNDSRKGFLRADPDAPATPSSYEMRCAALHEALERAEHAEAAAAKLEKMLAHAEERVKHNYEVAERRGKAIEEMREALEWVHMGSLCCDPATSYRSRADCPICKVLARAKEAGL